MLPEQIKEILDVMAKHGVIRITYDVCLPTAHDAEVWTTASFHPNDRTATTHLLTEEEKRHYESEYAKSFTLEGD